MLSCKKLTFITLALLALSTSLTQASTAEDRPISKISASRAALQADSGMQAAESLREIDNKEKTGAWSHRVQDLCIGKSFGLAFEEGTMAIPEQFKTIASLLLQFGYVREGPTFKEIFNANARENNPYNYKGKGFNEHLTICQILATAGAQIKSSGNTYFKGKETKETEFIKAVHTSLSSGIKGVKEETVETVLKGTKKLLGTDAHTLFEGLPKLTEEEKEIEALKLPEQNEEIDIPNLKQNLLDYAYEYNRHKDAIEKAKKAQSAGGWDTDVKDLNLKGVLGEWDNLEAEAVILKTYPGTALELYGKIHEAYLIERDIAKALLGSLDRMDAAGKLGNVMARFMKPVPVEKPEPVVEEKKPEQPEKPKPLPRPKTLKDLGEENHIFESVEPTKERLGARIAFVPQNEVHFNAVQYEASLTSRTDNTIKITKDRAPHASITGVLKEDAVGVFQKTVGEPVNGEIKGQSLIEVTVKHSIEKTKNHNKVLYFLTVSSKDLKVPTKEYLLLHTVNPRQEGNKEGYPTLEDIKKALLQQEKHS